MLSLSQDRWIAHLNMVAYECFSNDQKGVIVYVGYLQNCQLLNVQPSINIMRVTSISLKGKVEFLTVVCRIRPPLQLLQTSHYTLSSNHPHPALCCFDAGETSSPRYLLFLSLKYSSSSYSNYQSPRFFLAFPHVSPSQGGLPQQL